jgi:hypothetical protein
LQIKKFYGLSALNNNAAEDKEDLLSTMELKGLGELKQGLANDGRPITNT